MKDAKALLVVSFGTSYPETCERTIAAIEADLAAAFPDRRLYRAWTSRVIRRKVKEKTGVSIDSVAEAMERMVRDGVQDVLVQPTHLLIGEEYATLGADGIPVEDGASYSLVYTIG